MAIIGPTGLPIICGRLSEHPVPVNAMLVEVEQAGDRLRRAACAEHADWAQCDRCLREWTRGGDQLLIWVNPSRRLCVACAESDVAEGRAVLHIEREAVPLN